MHLSFSEQRRRTVVIDHSERLPRNQLAGWLARVSSHLPARLRSTVRRVVQPQVLLVLSAIASVLLAIGVIYYSKLAREIDARLQSGQIDSSFELVSAPLKLSVGDSFAPDELSSYLSAAGYQQRSPEDKQGDGAGFEIDGDSIEISPGDNGSNHGVSPVRIRIDKNGRVASLMDPRTGEHLSAAFIDGELLAAVREGDRRKRIDVQFSDIPEDLRNAILAAEDRRFFSHNGIDWHAILRALKTDVDHGEVVQGGSTITQQLIKSTFLTSDRTLKRKLKEAAMAIILESRLTKQRIFELYCNLVYLGQSGTFAINGFAQAAQVYFDKDLSELTLAESAFLAGLIHAPNRYSAHRDLSRAIERRNLILDAMVETGSITDEQAQAARSQELRLKKHESQNDYGTSYFIDYAQRFLSDRYGAKALSHPQRITTTIDPRLQRAAFESVSAHLEKLDKLFSGHVRKGAKHERLQAALVALDAHSGEVLAMVGGRSYDETQLNRATDAKRQPGSSFKPFVYATALSSRSYTAASVLSDTPQTFTFDGGRAVYKPSDYHGGFTNRKVTLREALTRSLNVPTVELAMGVGLGNVADLAARCGLDGIHAYPSMAIGTSEVTPLELAGAYTAFANGGLALRPLPVRSIDRADRDERLRASSARVFSPQVAYLMTNLMQSVVDEGTASKLRAMGIKGAVAGKTGTSNDGWFVGYTPELICVVWVGFDDSRDLRMKASDAALPIWADFARKALAIRPDLGGDTFTNPGGIVTSDIDPSTGLLSGPECPQHRQEVFVAGTEPQQTCSHQMMADAALDSELEELPKADVFTGLEQDAEQVGSVTVEVCSETGLLASRYCPHVEERTVEFGKEPRERCGPEFHR
ncbi:MAG TPA: PBP1A family penicillin-binding protein [Blastocatellia bacterium]|nr:PBP1A family penicillin-binding protein [Blastocatellia bacterium]